MSLLLEACGENNGTLISVNSRNVKFLPSVWSRAFAAAGLEVGGSLTGRRPNPHLTPPRLVFETVPANTSKKNSR